MSESLGGRVAAMTGRPVAPAVAELARRLALQAGAVAALFYGSNLRTGSLDGVIDYYLLLPGPPEAGLWPRVSYHEAAIDGQMLRAKVATMSLETFARAAAGQTLDTTILARFVQPSALVWRLDDAAAVRVRDALEGAAITAARLAAAIGPRSAPEAGFWKALFRATYRAELRVEQPGREDSILAANAGHFDGLLAAAWSAAGIAFDHSGEDLAPRLAAGEMRRTRRWWALRQRLGKPLNILRLIRATTTFEGAARYAAWKIERHTGIAIEVTPWRERHPLLAAPGVVRQLLRARRGAARPQR